MDDEEAIDLVLRWAETEPDFDTSFVDSLDEFIERRGMLTEGQRSALDNIIEKWGIEEWAEQNA